VHLAVHIDGDYPHDGSTVAVTGKQERSLPDVGGLASTVERGPAKAVIVFGVEVCC
jgi:hypothetical protein